MSVHVDDEGGVRIVLLDRADKRNAIDLSVVSALSEALNSAPGAALVLGSTSASFSAGADLDLADSQRAAVSRALYRLYALMRSTPAVIIAAASGHAVGGGAQLLLASDLRIASKDLSVRFMGPSHGLVVGAWGLPSLVGRGRALDLCLSLRPIGAEEAMAIGLVDRLVDDPLAAAIEYGRNLTELDLATVFACKRIVGTADPGRALALEEQHNAPWGGTVARRGGSE